MNTPLDTLMNVVTPERWTAAVAKLLETHHVEETKGPDGEALTKKKHATDPPANFRPHRRMLRPGPLPKLVRLADVPKGHQQVDEHTILPGDDPEAQLAHMALVVLGNARRYRAHRIALHPPVVEAGAIVLKVVNLLGGDPPAAPPRR